MIEGQETKVMSVRDAIIEAMSEEMRRDENVFLIGEDVGVYGHRGLAEGGVEDDVGGFPPYAG